MRRIAVVVAGTAVIVAGCGSSTSSSGRPMPAATARIASASSGTATAVPTVGPTNPNQSPAPKPARIDLRVVKEKGEALVIAPVTIHGQEYAFLVDTGASVTLVNAKLAAQLGLKPTGKTITGTGIGGSAAYKLANISNWAIGRSKIPTTTVATG